MRSSNRTVFGFIGSEGRSVRDGQAKRLLFFLGRAAFTLYVFLIVFLSLHVSNALFIVGFSLREPMPALTVVEEPEVQIPRWLIVVARLTQLGILLYILTYDCSTLYTSFNLLPTT